MDRRRKEDPMARMTAELHVLATLRQKDYLLQESIRTGLTMNEIVRRGIELYRNRQEEAN